MKTKMKKGLALALSLIMSTGIFASCGDEGSSTKKPTTSSSSAVEYNDGIHNYNVYATSTDFIKNGACEYKIVVPKERGKWVDFAAEELQLLFKEATGITLPIVTDDTVTAAAKVISLGETSLFNATEYKLNEATRKTLDYNGFIIKTVGDDVFITGAHDDGTNFGVYAFLEQTFNFDCFSNACYYIDHDVKNLKLKNFDVMDVPDLKVRNNGNSMVTNSVKAMRRMRYTGREDGSTFIGSSSAHTVFSYIAPKVYENSNDLDNYHPNWFATTGSQLCYTARGNDEEREALLNEVLEKMIVEFKANTTGHLFIFGQEDRGVWCGCDACGDSKEKYGADSAVQVQFCNDLADKMSAWMETDEGKPYARDFKIVFLAYQKTLTPPTTYNEKTKQYELIDGLVCNDRTAVMFAPGDMDFQKSLFDKDNEGYLRAFEGWGPVSSAFTIYSYQADYYFFLCPYDTFNCTRDLYKYAATKNTIWFFDLGQRKQSGSATGWTVLKNYLCSKLAWDVNADVEKYTDRFFEVCYGEAADEMRTWYNEYRTHSRYMIDHGGMAQGSSIYLNMLNEDLYPAPVLEGWVNRAAAALKAIEPVRYTDTERYNELYRNIVNEQISVQYMLIEIYADDYPSDYIYDLKLQVKAGCELVGIDVRAEAGAEANVSQLWTEWGIN